MHLAYPTNIWWLVPVGVVIALGVWALVRRAQAIRRLSAIRVRSHGNSLKRFGVRTLALLFLGLALLGPCWGEVEVAAPPARGRDLMIVLDVSRSMLAEDVQPNRLEHARQLLQSLVRDLAKSGGHRVGLIAFADRPVLLCPLTGDFRHAHDELKNANLLSVRLREGTAPSGEGTRLSTALRRARQTPPTPEQEHALEDEHLDILLVSDGGDESPAELDEIAASLSQRSIAVHALGIGDPTRVSSIPVTSSSGRRELLQHEGKVVQVKLEDASLRRLAERTGGHYFAVHGNAAVPSQLLATLAAKEQRELENKGQTTLPVHRFHWFLLPAILLLLLEQVIPAGAVSRATQRLNPWLSRLVPPTSPVATRVAAPASTMNFFSKT